MEDVKEAWKGQMAAAQKAWRREDFGEAHRLYMELAEAGHAEAQWSLGIACRSG